MGVNFHEVRAKSALNRVRGARYGFGWTINPYRGCTHACVFCLSGETPILMADGSSRPLATVGEGAAIYGTVLDGSQRRIETTRVLARWQTKKWAYRLVLEGGGEIIASADHRFLTVQGWKRVSKTAASGPHLSPGDGLVGASAIGRKLQNAGRAIDRSAALGVVSVEPLGRMMQMYDITTGTGDFIANGVVSHNCFARRTHTYLDFDAGRDFEREIVVKVNVPELLRAELARSSWRRELVALGTNTDPYQWAESRYRLMPEILAALEAAQTPVSVLTKSPLLMRDIEIYERMSRRLAVSVNLSVPTLDEKVWRATEPHTPSPLARLEAVAELRRRGIDSGVLIAPLMPGINDAPEQVQPIIDRAREAGASFLGGAALHLRDEVRDVFFAWLQAKRPDLIPRYEKLYSGGRSHLRLGQRSRLDSVIAGWSGSRAEGAGARSAPAAQVVSGVQELQARLFD